MAAAAGLERIEIFYLDRGNFLQPAKHLVHLHFTYGYFDLAAIIKLLVQYLKIIFFDEPHHVIHLQIVKGYGIHVINGLFYYFTFIQSQFRSGTVGVYKAGDT